MSGPTVYVPCTVSPSDDPGVRPVRVPLADGTTYLGVVSWRKLHDAEFRRFQPGNPSAPAPGFVGATVIDSGPASMTVLLDDGTIVQIPPISSMPAEDRGHPVYVWRRGRECSFAPFEGAARVDLSIPIGWKLAPDPERGVVLVDTFGREAGAGVVNDPAEMGRIGFRVRNGAASP